MEAKPNCGHPQRYRSIGGRALCERCARIEAGWKVCPAPRCFEESPPGETCSLHADTFDACPVCKGEGGIECPEFDCHGKYCDGEEEVACDRCGGLGVIEKEVAV